MGGYLLEKLLQKKIYDVWVVWVDLIYFENNRKDNTTLLFLKLLKGTRDNIVRVQNCP